MSVVKIIKKPFCADIFIVSSPYGKYYCTLVGDEIEDMLGHGVYKKVVNLKDFDAIFVKINAKVLSNKEIADLRMAK